MTGGDRHVRRSYILYEMDPWARARGGNRTIIDSLSKSSIIRIAINQNTLLIHTNSVTRYVPMMNVIQVPTFS